MRGRYYQTLQSMLENFGLKMWPHFRALALTYTQRDAWNKQRWIEVDGVWEVKWSI